MTKKHPLHRKKSIHMTFRRKRVQEIYWRLSDLLDRIKAGNSVT